MINQVQRDSSAVTKWTPYSAHWCAVCISNLRQHNCSWRAQLTFDVFGWLVGPKLRNSLHNYKDLKESGRRYTSIEVKLLTNVASTYLPNALFGSPTAMQSNSSYLMRASIRLYSAFRWDWCAGMLMLFIVLILRWLTLLIGLTLGWIFSTTLFMYST